MSSLVGQVFYHSFLITEELFKKFILLSNDNNPLHIDSKFAKSKGFRSNVVHGNLQNCFISYFVGEKFPIREVLLISQSIKFSKPLYINDNLTLEVKVDGFYSSVNVYELKFKFTVRSKIVSSGSITLKKL